jgi:hypothetical protein
MGLITIHDCVSHKRRNPYGPYGENCKFGHKEGYDHHANLAQPRRGWQRTRTNQHAEENFDRRGAGRSPFALWTADGPGKRRPQDPFIVLLKGLYQPVPPGQGPDNNLGLSSVNLNDGSYSKTRIFPVWIGIPASQNQEKAIGNFYVSLVTGLCAYDLPGGAIAMQFIAGGNFPVVFPDGKGGQYDEGTIPLTILEATGIYRDFAGGHNNMVDRLHQLVAGAPFAGFPDSGYDEFCFCIISQYQFP